MSSRHGRPMTSSALTVSRWLAPAIHGAIRVHHPRTAALRLLSATSSNSASSDSFPTARHEALTLLHKTITLAPAVLTQSSSTSRVTESPEFWNQNLTRIYEDLNSTAERPARVVVYGIDEWSGARELVDALLEEPISSDESLSRVLKDRWKDNSQGKITLSLTSPTTESSPSHISLPSSSYLSQFPVPIDITEIAPSPNTQPSTSGLDDASVAELFKADVPIIVCNLLSTPLSILQNAHLPSNTILVITSAPSAHALDKLGSISALSSKWKVIFADPIRAIDSIHILKADPNSSTAVQRYQDGFVGSRISSVTSALKASLEPVSSPSTSQSVADFRTSSALTSLEDTLITCRISIERVKEETNTLRRGVSRLNDRIEELKITAETDVLGMKERYLAGDSVKEALEKAEKDMKVLMDRLTWWKSLWRIDEVGTIVGSKVQQVWCPELEKKLILQTGKLSVIQQDLAKCSLSLLSSSPPPYNSAVLHNNLLQLQSSPSYPLTPRTLTHPLYSRRSQIIEYPTTRLHLAGQRIVMAMSGGVASGVGVSWSGWFGWFTGTGEGLFGIVGMEPATAVGVGMLGAIGSIRWAVGRWERAKKKWWADWTRVGEGLDRDLRTTVQQVVSDQVVVVADGACKGLTEMTHTRKEEMAALQEGLDKISAELQVINGHRKPNKP